MEARRRERGTLPAVASLDGLDIAGLIQHGREAWWLEYKQSAPWDELRLKIVKAALAFANTRGGGYIVIGMRRLARDQYEGEGMSDEHLMTYDLDTVHAGVNRYAEPAVPLDCAAHEHDGKRFYVVAASEFEDVPVICTRSADGELQRAAIYTRARRIISSAPIDNQTDMRNLLDLATEKALERRVEHLRSIGLLPKEDPTVPTDREQFAIQREEL